jgi:hypothetical protein
VSGIRDDLRALAGPEIDERIDPDLARAHRTEQRLERLRANPATVAEAERWESRVGEGERLNGERFAPEPTDWRTLIAAGIPEPEPLLDPYLYEAARTWCWGPTESGKSIWALNVGAVLSRRGVHVFYVSQENPLAVELRRIERLGPRPGYFHLYHDVGLDLARSDHREWLRRAALGAGLVVIDTLTACWSGDEADNAAIAAFDRELLIPLRDNGSASIVLDHTGHPQPFVRRKGASAGRGASTKGQKADVVLEFKADGEHAFTIEHGKNRPGGGRREPARTIEVRDTEAGGLVLVETAGSDALRIQAVAEEMVEIILGADRPITSQEVRTAAPGSSADQTEAMALLGAEDPPRVVWHDEALAVEGRQRQRAHWWRPAQARLS